MKPLLALAAIALLAAGCGATKTVTVTTTRTVTHTVTAAPATTTTAAQAAACTGGDLSASFDVQPDSAGAGQITYTLKLTNSTSSPCFVSGIPDLQLLDKNGNPLPTHQSAQPGTQTAVRVVLQPGGSATSDARFSPDVPGVGEQQPGQCESTSYTLRVTPSGGGTVDAPISPPTPVCEKGSFRFSNLSAA